MTRRSATDAPTAGVREAFRPPATERTAARRGSSNANQAFRPPAGLPIRKRNRLSLDAYRGPGRFFVTLATDHRQPHFRRNHAVKHCIATLQETCATEGYQVLAYCFMPNHVHALVATTSDDADLVRLVKRFKQKTGWWFRNRTEAGGLKASPTPHDERPRLWQKSYHDHVLRRDEDVADVIRYILENPRRAGLAGSPEEYPYCWSAYGLSDAS